MSEKGLADEEVGKVKERTARASWELRGVSGPRGLAQMARRATARLRRLGQRLRSPRATRPGAHGQVHMGQAADLVRGDLTS